MSKPCDRSKIILALGELMSAYFQTYCLDCMHIYAFNENAISAEHVLCPWCQSDKRSWVIQISLLEYKDVVNIYGEFSKVN